MITAAKQDWDFADCAQIDFAEDMQRSIDWFLAMNSSITKHSKPSI